LNLKKHITIILFFTGIITCKAQQRLQTDVLIVGGGTSGTAAGIQCARLGIKTVIVESSVWLGGMLSAAGVSATDGNHKLPSGLWREFRDRLYKLYGGAKAVETGWVSNTLFEPHVADSIFKAMAAATSNLQVLYNWQFDKAITKNNAVAGAIFTNTSNKQLQVQAKIVVDATELGDVMAAAKVPYSVGMEADAETKEGVGVPATNDVVQDLTYVAILKDFADNKDHTIAKPTAYTPEEFDGCCTDFYTNKKIVAPTVDAKKMLAYAKLPNNKYMLNWPGQGNDTYLNVIGLTPQQRTITLQAAKQTTLRFIYFIQTQLGFKNLGLADDEFPTTDKLALMPYYREGRRVKGVVRFMLPQLAKPFAGTPLYRTGIAVGDYPIDHHHKKNPAAPQHLDFYPVPSYNVPLGALIPEKANGLIVAEKGISVSNVVNGTTRLQPCVLLIGQAAGTLAALAVQQKKQPRQVAVRNVQEQLLKNGAYIMPYIDVPYNHPHFLAIQKIGATGILKGTGIPYKWANQTWFYPDSTIDAAIFLKDLKECMPHNYTTASKKLTVEDVCNIITQQTTALQKNLSAKTRLQQSWETLGLKKFDTNRGITRAEAAVMLQHWLQLFEKKAVTHHGKFIL
jgi:ribulose 1,5-bisphosphate synthetase/thiazole synthase